MLLAHPTLGLRKLTLGSAIINQSPYLSFMMGPPKDQIRSLHASEGNTYHYDRYWSCYHTRASTIGGVGEANHATDLKVMTTSSELIINEQYTDSVCPCMSTIFCFARVKMVSNALNVTNVKN